MGTGALVSTAVIPAAFNRAINSPDPILNGPELVFVRLRSGVSSAAGRTSLERIATVPVVAVVLVALGSLVFANLVAAIPGRIAARTPTAMVLRVE
jgi:hypothetical protein